MRNIILILICLFITACSNESINQENIKELEKIKNIFSFSKILKKNIDSSINYNENTYNNILPVFSELDKRELQFIILYQVVSKLSEDTAEGYLYGNDINIILDTNLINNMKDMISEEWKKEEIEKLKGKYIKVKKYEFYVFLDENDFRIKNGCRVELNWEHLSKKNENVFYADNYEWVGEQNLYWTQEMDEIELNMKYGEKSNIYFYYNIYTKDFKISYNINFKELSEEYYKYYPEEIAGTLNLKIGDNTNKKIFELINVLKNNGDFSILKTLSSIYEEKIYFESKNSYYNKDKTYKNKIVKEFFDENLNKLYETIVINGEEIEIQNSEINLSEYQNDLYKYYNKSDIKLIGKLYNQSSYYNIEDYNIEDDEIYYLFYEDMGEVLEFQENFKIIGMGFSYIENMYINIFNIENIKKSNKIFFYKIKMQDNKIVLTKELEKYIDNNCINFFEYTENIVKNEKYLILFEEAIENAVYLISDKEILSNQDMVIVGTGKGRNDKNIEIDLWGIEKLEKGQTLYIYMENFKDGDYYVEKKLEIKLTDEIYDFFINKYTN